METSVSIPWKPQFPYHGNPNFQTMDTRLSMQRKLQFLHHENPSFHQRDPLVSTLLSTTQTCLVVTTNPFAKNMFSKTTKGSDPIQERSKNQPMDQELVWCWGPNQWFISNGFTLAGQTWALVGCMACFCCSLCLSCRVLSEKNIESCSFEMFCLMGEVPDTLYFEILQYFTVTLVCPQ